jgi:PPP family 3-phenylpropionic acid transporter
MQKVWPFSLNFLFFAGVAFVLPFMVLYYQGLGLTGTEIGIILGLTPLITLFGAPLWTRLADTTHEHRLLMGIAMFFGALIIFLLPFFPAVAPTIVLIILLTIFFAPITSFADSATMFMLAHQKEMYGLVRVGGTFGFGLAAVVAGGVVQNYGLKVAFWCSAALSFLGFLVSQKLTYRPSEGSIAPKNGIGVLLTNPRWILFLALAFAGSLSLTSLNNYLFSYMTELGANGQMMGYALALPTASEALIFLFGNWLLKKFKPYVLLVIAVALFGVRLLALAVFNTPELVLIVQFVGGLTFPAMWIAGVSYANENAPAGMSATAQGLFGAMVLGFGTSVGGFLGGLLLDQLGGRGMFFVFGILVLVVVAIVVLIENRMPVERQILPNDI